MFCAAHVCIGYTHLSSEKEVLKYVLAIGAGYCNLSECYHTLIFNTIAKSLRVEGAQEGKANIHCLFLFFINNGY